MADIKAHQLRKPTFNGTYNNFSLNEGSVYPSDILTGDFLVLVEHNVGEVIHGFRLHWENVTDQFTAEVVVRWPNAANSSLTGTFNITSGDGSRLQKLPPLLITPELRFGQVCVHAVNSTGSSAGRVSLTTETSCPGI